MADSKRGESCHTKKNRTTEISRNFSPGYRGCQADDQASCYDDGSSDQNQMVYSTCREGTIMTSLTWESDSTERVGFLVPLSLPDAVEPSGPRYSSTCEEQRFQHWEKLISDAPEVGKLKLVREGAGRWRTGEKEGKGRETRGPRCSAWIRACSRCGSGPGRALPGPDLTGTDGTEPGRAGRDGGIADGSRLLRVCLACAWQRLPWGGAMEGF